MRRRLRELKIELPSDSAKSFLGIYPKTPSQHTMGVFMVVFITILLTTANKYNQPRYLSTDE